MKVYLDIETTGLSPKRHEVTIVGALVDGEVIQMVKGQDLTQENIESLFFGQKTVVTFNGKRFDVPFLEKHFEVPTVEHKDLMYHCHDNDLYGGLKKVEKDLEINRDLDCNGSQAIRLWREYEKGSEKALKKLLKYNREDVVNLVELEEKLENF